MRRCLLSCVLFASMILIGCYSGSDNGEDTDGLEAVEQEEGSDVSEDKVWQDIQESGEITVGTSGTLYPSSFYPEDSDDITGFEVEVQREIAERLDFDIQFETMAFDAMLTALDAGRIDMISVGLRGENKKRFESTQPIKYSYATMIVRSDDNSGIESLEDLEGKVAGGAATTDYSEIAEKFNAEVKTYDNVTNDAYSRAVHNGRTHAAINDHYLQSLT